MYTNQFMSVTHYEPVSPNVSKKMWLQLLISHSSLPHSSVRHRTSGSIFWRPVVDAARVSGHTPQMDRLHWAVASLRLLIIRTDKHFPAPPHFSQKTSRGLNSSSPVVLLTPPSGTGSPPKSLPPWDSAPQMSVESDWSTWMSPSCQSLMSWSCWES